MRPHLLLFCCLREEKEVSDEDGGNIVRQGDLGMIVRGAALLQHGLQREMLQLVKDIFSPPTARGP